MECQRNKNRSCYFPLLPLLGQFALTFVVTPPHVPEHTGLFNAHLPTLLIADSRGDLSACCHWRDTLPTERTTRQIKRRSTNADSHESRAKNAKLNRLYWFTLLIRFQLEMAKNSDKKGGKKLRSNLVQTDLSLNSQVKIIA